MRTTRQFRNATTRRELLRFGGLGLAGLSLPALLRSQARAAAAGPNVSGSLGRAKNVIYLFMSGGPSQYETFDPKPGAPAEIRGTFQPIATNVPGIHFCELLPRVARMADKLAVVRSMATDDPNHESGGYWVHTGYKYTGPNMRSISPSDWPTLGAVIKMLKPSISVPFTSVMLPEPIVANPNVFLPGQNAGFLGSRWDPEIFKCDPAAPDFEVEGFSLADDVSFTRLESRKDLLAQIDSLRRLVDRQASVQLYDRSMHDALDVLVSGKARSAFSLDQEAADLRDRYGRGKWGQSVLLARRLIEAGVRMVFVNWPREPGDLSVGNPLWDTHAKNDSRMKDVLCPQFDLGFTALIDDLDQRGLLAETLVVAIGEMGRTPRFNSGGGRDHWGNVFSFVLAGAGIRSAQVYGASDRNGSYPVEGRVQPPDLTATILHLLGLGHEATFPDQFGRPIRATQGEPIWPVLGDGPATAERTEPGGIITPSVPEQNSLLVNGDFEPPAFLSPLSERVRGWQAAPLWEAAKADELSVLLGHVPGPRSRSGEHHVGIGYGLWTGNGQGRIAQGTRAMLVQEVLFPRPGRYTFSIHASSGAYDRPDYYRDVWCQNFTCRLVIFGYANDGRDASRMIEFASQSFQPPFAGAYEADYRKYSVAAQLDCDQSQFSRGIGVAVIVEKTSPGELDVPSGGPRSQGLIRLEDAALEFVA